MLELSLLPEGVSSTEDAVFWFVVSNVGGGAQARYEGISWGALAEPVVLENYPRWAEPAGALCARLLSAAAKQSPAIDKKLTLPRFSIQVNLISHGRGPAQQLEHLDVVQTSSGWDIRSGSGQWHIGQGRSSRIVGVALRALIQVYWGSSRIRKVRPVTPKIYLEGKTPYIRMGDLPEPAQTAFARNMARSSRPFPPGVRDAAYAWDWSDFLEGGR